MRNILLITLLTTISFSYSIAQNIQNYCSIMEDAHQFYCNKKYMKVAELLQHNYADCLQSVDSHQNIKIALANSYFKAGKLKKAEKIYKSIIDIQKYPTEESIIVQDDCFKKSARCAGFVMPNRLLENQHDAYVMMAKGALKKKKWDKAYKQIQNADLYYRYWYGCGTTDLENDLKLSLLYATYYEKTKQIDSAISKLLTNILEPAAMPVAYYETVVKEAVNLIKKQYSKPERIKLLNEAIDNLYFISFESHHGDDESRTYYIKFLDVEIKASPEYLFEHNKDLDEVREFIRGTEFYKSIIN